MKIIINGKEANIEPSLFSYGEIIKKRDKINYPEFNFSQINILKGEKNILSGCFKDTKKEILRDG